MELSTTLRRFRRKVAGLTLVALVASLFATGVASAQTKNIYNDVPADAWYAPYVNQLADDGILDTTQDSYRPGDLVNRAEMAKLAVTAAGIPVEEASEAPFTDVPMGVWYTDVIYTASKNGVVAGDTKDGVPTGTYRPGDAVNRAEAAKIVVNAFQFAEDTTGGPHFPDVATDAWYYAFVETAFNNGLVAGYPDGDFRPGNNINRAEIAKVISLSMGGGMTDVFKLDSATAATDVKVELIFSMNVDEESAEMVDNYMIEDSSGSELVVTDAEVVSADTVHLSTDPQEEGKVYYVTVDGITSEDGEALGVKDSVSFLGYGTDVSGGDLEVKLSENTPQAGSVPSGATGVVFTCWDFMAGSDDVTLKSLHVKRVGPGDENDFTDVYLYAGTERLTTGRSINTETQTAEFNNINFDVDAGDNEQLCVVADLAGNNGGVHAFELTSEDSVMSNSSDMTGSFPMRGEDQLITSAEVGSITIEKNGSLDELTVGENEARIAQFDLEANGVEDQELRRIALYVRGSVTISDLGNFKLFAEGEDSPIAETDEIGSNDLLTFDLDDAYDIPRGGNRIFYVEADLNPGRDSDDIKVYLDETTDLLVVGKTFGYGVAVDSTAYDGQDLDSTPGTADDEFSYTTIKGSDFNISFEGPDSQDIAVNQNAAHCLDLTITNSSDTNVDIRDWQVTIDILGGTAGDDAGDLYDASNDPNFTLVKLAEINESGSVGRSLLGSSELPAYLTANDEGVDVTLQGDTSINAGESIDAAIIFDVANNAALEGAKIRCSLKDLTAIADAVRDENGDALGADSITPSSDIQGNVHTLVASSLTIAAASSPSAQTYTKGTDKAELLGIQIGAGSALDQTIKSISLQGQASVGTLKDIITTEVALYDGDTKVSSTENISSTGIVTFNNLDVKVVKNDNVTLTLRGDVSNSSPNTVVEFWATSANDIIAIDQNGETTTGIDISAIDSAADAPDMTIAASGTGTVANSNVNQVHVASAEKTFKAAEFSFSAQDGTSFIEDIDLAVLNDSAAAVKTVSLYTGDSCATELQSESPGSDGLVEFDSLGLEVTQNTDETICAFVTTNDASGSGEPTSDSNVGLVLVNVSDVSSTAGTVITPAFVGDNDPATNGVQTSTLNTAITAVTGVDVILDDTTVTIVAGDVIVIEEEYILYTGADIASAATQTLAAADVIRGFAGTTASTHESGLKVAKSTIATSVTLTDATAPANDGLRTGDVYSYVDAGNVKYCLVTSVDSDSADADAYTVETLPFSEAACSATGAGEIDGTETVTVWSIHGPLSKIYRSVPNVEIASSLPSSNLTGTTIVAAFSITPENNTVKFDNDVDAVIDDAELKFAYTANNATLTSCTLKEVTGGPASDVDTADIGAAASGDDIIAFDFADQVSDYTLSQSSGTRDYQIECDITLGGGEADLSTQIKPATVPVIWNDGETEITNASFALFPSSTTPQTTSR